MSAAGEEVRPLHALDTSSNVAQRELQELTGKHKPLPPPITLTAPPSGPSEVRTMPKPVRISRVLQAIRDEERASSKLAPIVDPAVPLPIYVFAQSKPRSLDGSAPHPPKEASPRQPAISVTPPQPAVPAGGSAALPASSAAPSYDKDDGLGPKRGLPIHFIHVLRSMAPWPDASRSKSPRREAPPSPGAPAASPPPPVTAPLSVRPVESYLCLDPQYTREGMALRITSMPPKAVSSDHRTAPASAARTDDHTLGQYLENNAQRRNSSDASVGAQASGVRARDTHEEEGREGTKKTRIADTGTAALDLASSSVGAQVGGKPDHEVYLVDAEWYRDWQQRTAELSAKLMASASLSQRTAAIAPMPQLNNVRLLESPNSENLRRGLREGIDFVVITENRWNEFVERYHAGPPIRRPRIPTHTGQPKTVLYPVYLNVPSLQHGSPITFDEMFTLKELKYYLCTKLSQPPYRCRLMLRRYDMEATEICNEEDIRTVFESNIRSGDLVGVQRDGVPDRIETSAAPPRSSYAASSSQMGVTSVHMEDEIRTQMNVRDNYYETAYPSSSRYAGDVMRPVIGASRQHGPMPQSSYYNDFDDADLAAAIAASLQDTPSGGAPATSTVPATAPATTHNMPPLIPTRTEHRPTALPLAGTHWMGIGDDGDDTEDDR